MAAGLRACPYCGNRAQRAATRCGYCWRALVPLEDEPTITPTVVSNAPTAASKDLIEPTPSPEEKEALQAWEDEGGGLRPRSR